jgi:hypothetical protein
VSSGRPPRHQGMADAEDGPRAVVELVQGERTVVLGLVRARTRGDVEVLDDLLKLQVCAGRLGWRVRISECRKELRELFDLLGMTERFECALRADSPEPPPADDE